MKKKSVLLVDDEKIIREIGREMIEALGFNCITAKNGNEGLKIYRENADEIILVVLDVEMPDISGEKVSRILSEEYPGIKIVFVSGYGKEYLEKKIFKKKINNFISKPLNVKQLSSKFEKMLGENSV
ncbi:MAG: response regulator [Acidobacteriota bacterium]